MSTIKLISTGVPQGSIADPPLFGTFINVLVKASSKCSVILYAEVG